MKSAILYHRHSNHATPVKEKKNHSSHNPMPLESIQQPEITSNPTQNTHNMPPTSLFPFHFGQWLTLNDHILSISRSNIRCLRETCIKGCCASILLWRGLRGPYTEGRGSWRYFPLHMQTPYSFFLYYIQLLHYLELGSSDENRIPQLKW